MNGHVISALEYQVLADYIAEWTRGLKIGDIVIEKNLWSNHHLCTLDDYRRGRIFEKFPTLQLAAVEDLIRKQRSPVTVFDASFPIASRYVLLESEELRELVNPPWNWTRYYERFPDAPGLYSMSRVGFSDDTCSLAVFHAWRRSGVRDDLGGIVVMRRSGDHFEIEGSKIYGIP